MRLLKLLTVALALGLFQGSLEISWSLGGVAPDILLLWVIWLGMKRQTGDALLVAFVGGLVLDSVAPFQPIGLSSLCKVVVAYLPEWAHYILLPENRATGWLVVGIGSLLQQILFLTTVQTLQPGTVWGRTALVETGLLLALNLLVWIPTSFFLSSVKESEFSV